MNIKNIITLIKAGYSASDIKNISRDDFNNTIDLLENGIDRADIPEYLDLMREQPNNDPAEDPGGDSIDEGENNTGKPDYEQMYNDLLKQQQKKNTDENIGDESNTKDAYKILTDFLEGK